MSTELAPIFKLRQLCLAVVNPKFYAKHADFIYRSALAAQEYIFSGASKEYKAYMGNKFQDLPEYQNIYRKYKLVDVVHPNLIMDLMWSFKTDCINGIIDARGNIKNTAILNRSRVMGTYHNSDISGVPINAFRLYPEKTRFLLDQAQQKIK